MVGYSLPTVLNLDKKRQLRLKDVIVLGGFSLVQRGEIFNKQSPERTTEVARKRIPLKNYWFQLSPKVRRNTSEKIIDINPKYNYTKRGDSWKKDCPNRMDKVEMLVDQKIDKKLLVQPSNSKTILREIDMLEKVKNNSLFTKLIASMKYNNQWVLVMDLQLTSVCRERVI